MSKILDFKEIPVSVGIKKDLIDESKRDGTPLLSDNDFRKVVVTNMFWTAFIGNREPRSKDQGRMASKIMDKFDEHNDYVVELSDDQFNLLYDIFDKPMIPNRMLDVVCEFLDKIKIEQAKK